MRELNVTAGTLAFKMDTSFDALQVKDAPKLMVKDANAPESAWEAVKNIYLEHSEQGDEKANIVVVGEGDALLGFAGGIDRTLAKAINSLMNAAHALRKHAGQLAAAYVGCADSEIRVVSEKTGETRLMMTLDHNKEPMRVQDKLQMVIADAARAGRFILVSEDGQNVLPSSGLYAGYGEERMPIVYGQDERFMFVEGDMAGALIRDVWEPCIAVTRDAATLIKHLKTLEALAEG